MSFISNLFQISFLGLLLPILLGSSILLWRWWLILLRLCRCVIFPSCRWMVAPDRRCMVTSSCCVASVLSITSVWLLGSWVIATYRCRMVASLSGRVVTSLSGGMVTSLGGWLVTSVPPILPSRAVPILAWLTPTILAIFGWRSSILAFRRAILVHVILTFVGVST